MFSARLWVRQASPFRTGPASIRAFSRSAAWQLKLAYEHYGPSASGEKATGGSPIIVIHGLFGSKKNNRSVSKRLAKDLKRDVYVLDMRNHGDSPHDTTHNYDVLAEDVEEFMDTHGLVPATLIGHSMGAKTVMAVALHKPEYVANLIPVDNAPVDAALGSDFGTYVRGMKKVDEAGIHSQKEGLELMEPFEENIGIRQFLLGNLIRKSSSDPKSALTFQFALKTLSGALDNMADFPYKDPETARYKGPTLMIRGTESKYVADETLPAVGQFFPKFELRDIESGHWVISEKPNEFLDAVKEFLQDKT